jgi:tetratricopeptide (TPR) repeat protein
MLIGGRRVCLTKVCGHNNCKISKIEQISPFYEAETMKADRVHKACTLTIALSAVSLIALAIFNAPAAHSQGMMEYAGLMAMPKGLPSGDTIKNLTRGFGAIPNALPGQSAAPAIPASIAIIRPDGTVAVDPKKVHDATVKANSDQLQAKQILSKAGPSPIELKQAEKDLREAITLRNSIWGYEDPTIPKLLNQLGNTYERLKQPAMAKPCYQNAIKYINKKYGFGSSERLDTFVNLAPLLVKEGDLSEALSLQQQITLIKERKTGATDIGTIEARLAWAGTAKALDKPNAADIYKQCLTDLDKAGGSISPDKVGKFKSEILPSYIEVLKKQGREDEAKDAAVLLSSVGTTAGSSATAPTGTATGPAAVPAPSNGPATPTNAPAAASVQQTAPPATPNPAVLPASK